MTFPGQSYHWAAPGLVYEGRSSAIEQQPESEPPALALCPTVVVGVQDRGGPGPADCAEPVCAQCVGVGAGPSTEESGVCTGVFGGTWLGEARVRDHNGVYPAPTGQ